MAPLLSFPETGDELKCPSDYGLPGTVLNIENRQNDTDINIVFDSRILYLGTSPFDVIGIVEVVMLFKCGAELFMSGNIFAIYMKHDIRVDVVYVSRYR